MSVRALVVLFVLVTVRAASGQGTEAVSIRGRSQVIHLYGRPGAPAVVVSSGDGGWIHLGPELAQSLANSGYFVLGFDVKAYLSSFTSGSTTLDPHDVSGDFRVLIERAARGSLQRPILIGVSEGAGLSVLAATDPQTKNAIDGVIALGLPDLNELGWRWRDSIIYLTKGVPNEPTFSVAAIIAQVAPLPMAVIQSSRDEYVPPEEIARVMASAREPKQLWTVDAADHRFSNNLAECERRMRDALQWIRGAR